VFKWKENGNQSFGIIAQELEKVLPELVTDNDNGLKSVNYLGLIAFLIEDNKYLHQRINELEKGLKDN